MDHSTNPETAAIHADDGLSLTPAIAPPIDVSTTYDRSEQGDMVYRRVQHPITERLEAVLGALEGGHAVVTPSGMGAITLILRHLRPKRIAMPDDAYHGLVNLVDDEVAAGTLEIVPPEQLEAGDLWWLETPSNPKCLIADIAAIAEEAKARGVITAVDSTFATPVLLRPLELGADFVMHSATKFIGGHSDAMGGVVVVGEAATAEELRRRRKVDGATPGSLDVFLLLRGIRTMPLRVHHQSASAQTIAEHLHGKVEKVWYPGLSDHPGHDIAMRQMKSGGCVLSFEVESAEKAQDVMARLKIIRMATSLGGVETLGEWRLGVDPQAPPGLIRVSVGLEAVEDLIADLDAAIAG